MYTDFSHYHLATLLQTVIKNKRLGMLCRGVVLLHDNATLYLTQITKCFTADMKWTSLTHTLCLPDLALFDFELFAKLKQVLGGMCFTSNTEWQNWYRAYFTKLDNVYYNTTIQKLIMRYESCLNNLGDYVEK